MKTIKNFTFMKTAPFIKLLGVALLCSIQSQAQLKVYPKTEIKNLNVIGSPDPWVIYSNLQVGDIAYGGRTYTWSAIPNEFVGETWIQLNQSARAFTAATDLATFELTSAADVYIFHVSGITTKPAWLQQWTALPVTSDYLMTCTNTDKLYPYVKSFPAGSTVHLGQNGNTTRAPYMVIVKNSTATQIKNVDANSLLSITGNTVSSKEFGDFSIYNLSGSLIQSFCNTNKVNFTLPTGIYMFHFKSNNGVTTTFKLPIK